MNRIILMLIATMVLHACKSSNSGNVTPCKDYVFDCNKFYPVLALKNFTTGEMDTLILHKYPYLGGFTGQPVTEHFVYNGDSISYAGTPGYKNIRITDEYDYIIEIPGANKRYTISSFPILKTTDTLRCGSDGHPRAECYTWASHVVVNNDTVGIGVNGKYNFYILLTK